MTRWLWLSLALGGLVALLLATGVVNGTDATTAPDDTNSSIEPRAQADDEANEDGITEIEIVLGNFFFRGPDGTSGPEGNPLKSDVAIPTDPTVVARLKNGERVRLVFKNRERIPHEVISPLFSAPEEKTFPVPPRGQIEIELTPAFKTVEDGQPLRFDLACHVRHGSSTDHFKLGMWALIEVVPSF